ncbi:MAG: bile acid:sodium symporter [Pirellulales bacterium]|nr:bile acid:sodium symporter [Pirellulales bacterium]
MLLRFLRDRWFLILLVVVMAAGFGVPRALLPLTEHVPDRVLVAVVLFVMSVSLDASSMWRALSRPRAVMLAVGINLGLLPLVAWPLSRLLPAELGTGYLVAASIPSTLASAAVWTRRAGGNDAVAVLCTMITNMSCFFVTPLWLAATTGRDVSMSKTPQEMMIDLLLIVVLPMACGQLARLLPGVGAVAHRRRAGLGEAAQIGILIVALVGATDAGNMLASGRASITWFDTLSMITMVIGLHLSMLFAGHLIGRVLGVPREDRIAVGFGGSQKTLMVGLHIARENFTGLAMLPLIAYHVSQLFVDAVIAERLRKGEQPADSSTADGA